MNLATAAARSAAVTSALAGYCKFWAVNSIKMRLAAGLRLDPLGEL